MWWQLKGETCQIGQGGRNWNFCDVFYYAIMDDFCCAHFKKFHTKFHYGRLNLSGNFELMAQSCINDISLHKLMHQSMKDKKCKYFN